MTTNKPIGLAARKLDAAMEHVTLMRKVIDSPEANDARNQGGAYTIRAICEYVKAALGILREHVTLEGQLCPYDDCAWDCGFNTPGWYICPNCGRYFYARTTDNDIEDFHVFREDERDERPINPKLADNLGPSWGTPK